MLENGRERRVIINFDTDVIENKLNTITRLRRQRNACRAESQTLEEKVRQLNARIVELEEAAKIKVSDPEIDCSNTRVEIQAVVPEFDTDATKMEPDAVHDEAKIQVVDPKIDNAADGVSNQVEDPAQDNGELIKAKVSDPDNDKSNHEIYDEGQDYEDPYSTPLDLSREEEQEEDEDDYVPPTPPSGSPFRPTGRKLFFGTTAMPAAFRQQGTLDGFGLASGTSNAYTWTSQTNSAFGTVKSGSSGNTASSAFGTANRLTLSLINRCGLWDENWGEVTFTALPDSDGEDEDEPVNKKRKLE